MSRSSCPHLDRDDPLPDRRDHLVDREPLGDAGVLPDPLQTCDREDDGVEVAGAAFDDFSEARVDVAVEFDDLEVSPHLQEVRLPSQAARPDLGAPWGAS